MIAFLVRALLVDADLDGVMREIKATLAEKERREALRNATDEPGDEPPPPPWMRG